MPRMQIFVYICRSICQSHLPRHSMRTTEDVVNPTYTPPQYEDHRGCCQSHLYPATVWGPQRMLSIPPTPPQYEDHRGCGVSLHRDVPPDERNYVKSVSSPAPPPSPPPDPSPSLSHLYQARPFETHSQALWDRIQRWLGIMRSLIKQHCIGVCVSGRLTTRGQGGHAPWRQEIRVPLQG